MTNDNIITSLQNPKIKDLIALQEKSRLRKEKGMFVVEGRREIGQCIDGGYEIVTLFYCPEIFPSSEMHFPSPSVYEVSPSVYEKIAYRGGTEGIIAIGKVSHPTVLENLIISSSPLILVLESVEKPGNLGAILRTADASGVTAVIICDPLTDLFNPNLIRASLGGVFTQNVIACTSEEAISWLKKLDIRIFTAQLQDSEPYYDIDMTGPTAIVFGTESDGLSSIWTDVSDEKIYIPMLGKLDSLNVSVSVAVLCYEALRQRR